MRVRADAGYGGIEKRQAHQDRQVAWHIAIRAGQHRKLARDALDHLVEQCKSSMRSKVEHVFLTVKKMFDYSKSRYRGLGKKENRLAYCQDSPICYPHSLVGCEFYGITRVLDKETSGEVLLPWFSALRSLMGTGKRRKREPYWGLWFSLSSLCDGAEGASKITQRLGPTFRAG